MLIDMHNHTKISSPCSVLSPEELIETARMRGIDAICVTDHLFIEGATVAQEVGRKMNFPVFRGIEARSELGDMLVYGYYQDIPNHIPLDDLCRSVHESGGIVFVAHPYHVNGGGVNLYTCLHGRGSDLDADWDKVPVLRQLDGIEVMNGQADDKTNAKADVLASRLQVAGIGGSDAHVVDRVARVATRFDQLIRTDEELVEALKKSSYQAVRLRY
ncbi:MAG: PHP domain-containing protein [Anaerolineae bacterium]|nr:PHP domain-containing protein [Anaerolineae bacterium]